MRILLIAILSIAQLGVIAQQTETTPLTQEAKEQLRKERREKRMRDSGGIVEKKQEGNKLMVVNASSVAPMSAIDETARSIRQLVLIEVESLKGEAGKKYRPTKENPAIVALVDDPDGDTTILVAPEQNWAEINVSLLAKDNPSPEVLSQRLHKEVWRASAMAMGAANAMTQPCLLRQINTLRELDHTKNMLPSPGVINNMIDVADKLCIVRAKRATYRRACEEGWAPATTNDVQKAIWESVSKLPEKPLKIEFDAKKGK